MKRVIELPCTIGDKLYAKVGDRIRELEICDIAVFVYSDRERVRVAAFIEFPDPFYSDGRMRRKVFNFSLEDDAYHDTRGFLSRKKKKKHYA